MKMTDHGKRGKPDGFPPFPQSLDPAGRAPHFHSAYYFQIKFQSQKIKTDSQSSYKKTQGGPTYE
ncbi:MAG: hypothetical protein KKG79_01610 [Acidobacteria bacterium]|nr:hypothetical protein [Acidobacteriota bacterium]